MQSEPTSKTGPTTTKNEHPKIPSIFYNRKQVTKAVKIISHTSAGLGPASLKKLSQITTTRYARSKWMKCKFFNECNFDHSSLHNPYPTYKLRHKNGNRILQTLNMMIVTPEHGSLILGNLFLAMIKLNHAQFTHVTTQVPKSVAQPEQIEKVPRKFSPKQTDYLTEGLRIIKWILMRK